MSFRIATYCGYAEAAVKMKSLRRTRVEFSLLFWAGLVAAIVIGGVIMVAIIESYNR